MNNLSFVHFGKTVKLGNDLNVKTIFTNAEIRVKKGFRMDKYPKNKAEILKLWLYSTHQFSRARCDLIILEVKYFENRNKFWANVEYYWSRAFGWIKWEEMDFKKNRSDLLK